MAVEKYNSAFGDYEFSCVRRTDNTYEWSRRLRNTLGAQAEVIQSIEDVPVEVLKAFSRVQVAEESGRLRMNQAGEARA